MCVRVAADAGVHMRGSAWMNVTAWAPVCHAPFSGDPPTHPEPNQAPYLHATACLLLPATACQRTILFPIPNHGHGMVQLQHVLAAINVKDAAHVVVPA